MLDQEDLKLRQRAASGKYRPLFMSFVERWDYRWRATFEDIEEILGSALPPSARRHSAWWSNTKSHSQALAWIAAGWKKSSIDMKGEMVVFERPRPAPNPSVKRGKMDFPVHHVDVWPEGLSLRREDIYEDRI